MKHLCLRVLCCFLAVLTSIVPTSDAEDLPPQLWEEVRKLVASDGADTDNFGNSVSVSGDTVIVGAPWDDDAGDRSGSAYVFERHQGGTDNWGQAKKLTADDTTEDDRFGDVVSISGDTLIVGAYRAPGVYVFERHQGGTDNWGQVKKLIAPDTVGNDKFGFSASISGHTVVIGAYNDDDVGPQSQSGSAYVFERDQGGADNWGQVKKLTASDAAASDLFGWSVAISGDHLVVGAYWDDHSGSVNAGSAYVFARDQDGANNWGEVKKLTASDAMDEDDFGRAVAISGDTLVVGTDKSGERLSAAYVFQQDRGGTNNWGEVKHFNSFAAEQENGGIGRSLAMQGDILLGGTFRGFAPPPSGRATNAFAVFERDLGGTDDWGEISQVVPSDGWWADGYGASMSIDGDTIVSGARKAKVDPIFPGAVYVIEKAVVQVPAPALSLVKSGAWNAENLDGFPQAGETVTYTYAVTNTGNVTLADVTVTDPHSGLSVITCLPVQGSTLSCTATYTLTQTDIDAGQVDNTGSASAEAPGGDPEAPGDDVTAGDTLSLTLPHNRTIAIVKSSDANGTNGGGNVLTYTYDVTNTGNVTLANVTVTDPHSGLSAVTCVPAQGSILAPGAAMQCTATYAITQADVDAGQIDNTGSVSAEAPDSAPITASDTLSEPLSPPAIDLVKQASPPVDVGGGAFETTITLTLTNTGSLALSDVAADDDLAASFPLPATFSVQTAPAATGTLVANPGYDGASDTALLLPASSLPLAATETVTFTVRFVPDDQPACASNVASASARSPSGTTVTDTATAGVNTPAVTAVTVAAGQDFLSTGSGSPGSGSYTDFAVDPLPSDFFDPGSDAFGERVNLIGVPLDPASSGDADTVISRLAPADLPLCASSATVPIEVTGIRLANAAAMTVTYGGGSPELWDVEVGVSTLEASTGTMTVDNECGGAGTWDSTFELKPRYVFTRRSDGATRVLAQGPTKLFQATDGHWVHSLSSVFGVPGTDFFPGFETVPCTCGAGCPVKRPTNPVVHVASGGAHTVWLPRTTIGAALQASPPVSLGGGEYETTFTVTLENLGNVDLDGVGARVDLDAAFPAPASFSLQGVPVATGTFNANPAYDGSFVVDLLTASTLAIDGTETVTFTVRFNPDDLPARFNVRAVATGTSSNGGTSDVADDGTDPDPNGNRNPADPDESDPTRVDVGHASSYRIDAGTDFLTTDPGSSADFAAAPIEAGFFDPGSDAFTGRLDFAVGPLAQSAGDPIVPSDTVVVRQGPADLTQCPSAATVPIELVALGLVSQDPVTVTYAGTSPELWDVKVSVSSQAASAGTMTVRFECSGGGGTFDSTLTMLPRYVFTRHSDGATRVLDPGPTRVFEVQGAHWVESLSAGAGVLQAGPGVAVDGDGDGTPDLPLAFGSSNFFPGYQISPCDCDPKAVVKAATASIAHVASDGEHRVSLTRPRIGLAKQATVPSDLGGGQLETTYTLTVVNLGNTDLWNVQVSDDLAATFPPPASFTVAGLVAAGDLTVNPAYDGTTDTGLLVPATSKLTRDTEATITFTVTFEPAAQPATFTNTAVATAESGPAGGVTVSADEATTIYVAQEVDLVLTETESIDPVVAGSAAGNLTYVVRVTNNGPENASGVVLSEALTLPAETTVASVTPSAGTFGGTTWTLGDLASGADATLTVVLTVAEMTSAGSNVICSGATLSAVDQVETDNTNDSVSECTSVQDPCGADPDCLYVPAGSDCWQTACGRTTFSFCGDTALPAEFFAAGSEAFTGQVQLGGSGFPDTEVLRLASMILPGPDSVASVPVELVALALESCEPITVIIDGQPVAWDVDVRLSDVSAGAGTLNVSRTHANGGVFDARFPLQAHFTFTRVDDPIQVREYDTGDLGLATVDLSTVGTAPWVAALTFPGSALVCGTGFVPGLVEDPVTFEQCCRKVGHTGPEHLHETTPPDCTSCPQGACCNSAQSSCTVVSSVDDCPSPGEYKGDGTDCRDSDGDGLADVLESNSCCSTGDSCNVGTDPNESDTDGDGILDGQEIADGTDPCVDASLLFRDGFESGGTSAWSSSSPPQPAFFSSDTN